MGSYAWRDDFFPGCGFDSLRGDPKQQAVIGKLVKPESAAGQKGGTSFIQVRSVEEFDRAISLGVDIDVGIGLFGGSAAFDYKNQCKVSTEATFVMIRVVAINPYERLAEPALTPAAWELLENKNTTRFKQQFGDTWVAGQTTGVTYFGTVRIEAASRAEQQSIAAQIEASYGFFNKGEADLHFDLSKHSQTSRIEIFVQQNGGEVALCTSVEELFTGARDALQKAREGKAAPFAVQVNKYNELKLPEDDDTGLDVEYAHKALTRYLSDLQSLETRLNSIRYVFDHANWYVPFDPGPLNEAMAQIAEQMNKIREAADVCVKDAKSCIVITPEFPAYTIPQRLADAGQGSSPEGVHTTILSSGEMARQLGEETLDFQSNPALSNLKK
jgi:hypothetical protein